MKAEIEIIKGGMVVRYPSLEAYDECSEQEHAVVSAQYRSEAREVADRTGRPVEVYVEFVDGAGGWMAECIEPSPSCDD